MSQHTPTWQELIKKLASLDKVDLFPLLVYRVRPPSHALWPESLLSPPEIRSFYSLCDGGHIADARWFGIAELEKENRWWADQLRGYHVAGVSVIDPKLNLVFGEDSGGCPMVWRRDSNQVATFQYDGGDWEPTGLTFDGYLRKLFAAPAFPNDSWWDALQQLLQLDLANEIGKVQDTK
ncbi:MAG: hypothetical protein ABSH20_04295 [Tepidisphaeraceae bacterium]|jgi:hypothetical protein